MIPWMWKSGMTVREQSATVSWSEAAMFSAERARLRWRRGTIFGREVVPDVWSARLRRRRPSGGPLTGASMGLVG